MSVQCNVCAKAINAANDRVFCFGGCGQVLHPKCADLTNAEALTLRENVSINFMCHDCRKKQVCLNTMAGKCEEILRAINDIKYRVKKIESNCEGNKLCEALKKSEQNVKIFVQETIKVQLSQLRSSGDKCLGAEKQNVQNKGVSAVGEGLTGSDGNPSSSYAVVTSGNIEENSDSVLRSGRVRNKGAVTPTVGGNGHQINSAQSDANAEIVIDERGKSSKKPMDCTVRIKPAVQQTNQQTKKEVRNKINPSQMGIKSVRNGMNGAIIVECGTKTEAEGLLNKVRDELGDNYEAAIPQPKRPRIKILGVEDEYDDDELRTILKSQNDIENVQYLKVVKTIKRRRGVYTEFTLICETDPSTFEQIMRRGRLFIDLDSCRVTECVDILRCYKCCGFSHKSQECKNNLHCARCAGDHDIKECSSEQVKCINCAVSNKERKTTLDVNHTAWSFDCPVYLKRVKFSRQYIGYDK